MSYNKAQINEVNFNEDTEFLDNVYFNFVTVRFLDARNKFTWDLLGLRENKTSTWTTWTHKCAFIYSMYCNCTSTGKFRFALSIFVRYILAENDNHF